MPPLRAPRRGLRLPLPADRLRRPVLGHHRPADQREIRRQPAPRDHRAGGREDRRHARPSHAGSGRQSRAWRQLTARRYSRSKARYLIDAAAGHRRRASWISKACREGSAAGGGKAAHRPARHRHLDGALCADAGRLCRCGAGGRQRPGHGAAAAAQAAGTARCRRDGAADERVRAASQPRHHASVDLSRKRRA